MSADVIMLIIAGAFAGGFANGLAGFGTGLFALGWWLAAMPPLDAVPAEGPVMHAPPRCVA